jgi:hypothetical protein
MRAIVGAMASALLGTAVAWCGSLEVSTGYLIGPRYDPHAFYVRTSAGAAWQKTSSSAEFRKQAQGRLLGVTLTPAQTDLEPLAVHGLQLVRLALQSPSGSLFAPDGSLRPQERDRLHLLLDAASAQGIAVELVFFDPAVDQDFDSPDAMLAAVSNLTDWLIGENHRNVLLDPAADWSAPGWDFDHFVPQNLERIAALIRQRFQAKRTDYALPVVITSSNRLAENSSLVQEADVIVARGEALALDPRRVERPVLVREKSAQGCALALERFAGCLVEEDAGGGLYRRLAPLVLKSVLKSPKP